jgi:hypothetical protein
VAPQSGADKDSLLPFALHRGPTLCLFLAFLALGATAGLLGVRSSLPVWFHLWMGAMSLGGPALGYVHLRRSALLQKEGLRAQGTVIDHRIFYGLDNTIVALVVSLEEPFMGRVVKLPWRTRNQSTWPIGSKPPLLVHPSRDLVDLDEPGSEVGVLLFVAVISVTFVLLPAWAEWQMR